MAEMGESRALPGFGQIDLDLGDEAEIGSPAVPGEDPGNEAGRVARRSAIRPSAEVPTFADPVDEEEETRVMTGDAFASLPPLAEEATQVADDWPDEPTPLIDAVDDAAPTSQRSHGSTSGVATRDARVATMRELYARGDAEGALALATAITTDGPPPIAPIAPAPSGDHPDASIYIEVTPEDELDESLGGLLRIEEGTVQVSPPTKSREMPRAPRNAETATRALLTLTERQSIPRIVQSPGEVAKLPIDPRGGFLLGQVDGMQTVEEILDVCAMPAAEALEILEQLRELGVIQFD